MSFSIYQLKPQFQRLLQPLMRALVRLRVSPNQITVMTMLLSIAYGAALAWQPQRAGLWIGLAAFLLLRMALNAIDGMLAREFGQQSRLGAYLNELTDVIADSALFLPFALIPGVNLLLILLVTLGAIFSEYAGVLGPMVGASRRYDGPMGKSDRALVFGVIGAGVAVGWFAPLWINIILALVAGLLVYTLINRVRRGLAELPTSQDTAR